MSWFSEKINTIDKALAKWEKEEKDGTVTNIRSEKGYVITELDTKVTIREYHGKLPTRKFKKFDEVDHIPKHTNYHNSHV
jgi:6-phosphogluconolactonase (cycloisomerase 2 family)